MCVPSVPKKTRLTHTHTYHHHRRDSSLLPFSRRRASYTHIHILLHLCTHIWLHYHHVAIRLVFLSFSFPHSMICDPLPNVLSPFPILLSKKNVWTPLPFVNLIWPQCLFGAIAVHSILNIYNRIVLHNLHSYSVLVSMRVGKVYQERQKKITPILVVWSVKPEGLGERRRCRRRQMRPY